MYCSSMLVTSTMVSDAASLSHNLRADYAKGTGLTDGFPPNGVDGHEVRVQVLAIGKYVLLFKFGTRVRSPTRVVGPLVPRNELELVWFFL
jgi:hypothetical protein